MLGSLPWHAQVRLQGGDTVEQRQPPVPRGDGSSGNGREPRIPFPHPVPTSHSFIPFLHPIPASHSRIPFPHPVPSPGCGGGGTYSSLRPQRRLVGLPYLVRVSVSSWYSVSPSVRGMPSQARMRMMMTAFWQWWPARCRTRHSSFSSWLCLRITWKTEGPSQSAPINTSRCGEDPGSGSWMPSPVPCGGAELGVFPWLHSPLHSPRGLWEAGLSCWHWTRHSPGARVGSPKEFP